MSRVSDLRDRGEQAVSDRIVGDIEPRKVEIAAARSYNNVICLAVLNETIGY